MIVSFLSLNTNLMAITQKCVQMRKRYCACKKELTSIEQGDDNVNRNVRFPFPVGRVHRLLKKGNQVLIPSWLCPPSSQEGQPVPIPS